MELWQYRLGPAFRPKPLLSLIRKDQMALGRKVIPGMMTRNPKPKRFT